MRTKSNIWEDNFIAFSKRYSLDDISPSFTELIERISNKDNPIKRYRIHLNRQEVTRYDTYTFIDAEKVIGFLFDKIELYGWKVIDVDLMRYIKTDHTIVIWLKERSV